MPSAAAAPIHATRGIVIPPSVKSNSMLPETVGNLIQTCDSLSRSVLKLALLGETAIDGLTEITTIALDQQKSRMLLNLQEA